MRSLALIIMLSIPAAGGRAQDEPGPDRSLASAPVEEPAAVDGFPGVNRLFRAGPIYLAGQPDREVLRRLVEDGVTVIVNLRPPEEMESVEFDEPAYVESLGVDYVSIPIGQGQYAPRVEAVDQLREALEGHEGKVLIHCSHAIRASHLWAAHLVRDRGVDRDQVDRFTNITIGTPARVDRFLGVPTPGPMP